MAEDSPPLPKLSRHFFDALFDLGFLDVAGADSFRSLIAGVVALLVSLGLLLTRMLMVKYASVSMAPSPEPFRRALLGDDLMLLSLPMLLIAFVTVLLGQSLFPDEIDFRVLVPLPISRRVIFQAKLVALLRFSAIFIGGCLIALTPVMLLGSISRWAEAMWLARLAAMWTAGAAAAIFSLLGVAGVYGVIMTWVPGVHRRVLSTLVRSGLIAAIVLALPWALRLPAVGPDLVQHSAWGLALPPAWFVGVAHVLLGDVTPIFARLASIAGIALTVATLVTVSCYVALYRRFDRVMLRAHRTLPTPLPSIVSPFRLGAPPTQALHQFVGATLSRSPLHQGVLAGVGAIGLAAVTSAVLDLDLPGLLSGRALASDAARAATIHATFTLVFVAIAAIRLSFLLPADLRANWIFRMTESDASRADTLRAVSRTLAALGVFAPIGVAFPILFATLGPSAVPAAAIATLFSLLLAELVLRDWQRLPFTCTWLPGKRSLAQVVLLVFTAFVAFTTLGRAAVSLGLRSATHASIVITLLAVAILVLQRRRRRHWCEIPLDFEDVSPYRVESMRLSTD